MTNDSVWRTAGKALFLLSLVFALPARADFEVSGPDGRKILLRTNGTWQYVENKESSEEPAKRVGEATMFLERKIDEDNGCRFSIRLVNNLPYEIGNIVPEFSAYRADGVVYETVTAKSSFARLKPGDQQRRDLQFRGITCRDITRLQVRGGDKCEMDDLNKWSDGTGRCLERVRVVESDIVRFDK